MNDPVTRLQRVLARRATLLEDALAHALADLARAHGDLSLDRHAKIREVAAVLSRLLACADLSGRLAVRFPAAKAPAPERYAAGDGDVPGGPLETVPRVAFEAAVRDLAERDPVGAQALADAGLEVTAAYDPASSTGFEFGHAFAAARAADAETATRVRDLLASSLERGTPTPAVVRKLVKAWNWPRAYAETVTRTNFATATSAGRFQEAARVQASSGLRVGFEFQTAGDRDVRATHRPMDGLVARQDDPVWRRFSPPLGFNCRCVLVPVFGERVPEGFVTAPAGARAEPGFGSRPGLATYGA